MSLIVYLNKARKYCSYQDRCEDDVVQKLKKFKLRTEDIDTILNVLKEEKFVDDQRFASSFVRGKLKQNQWGRIKIRYALKAKRLSNEIVDEALEEIDDEVYKEILILLATKKIRQIKGDISDYDKRQKTAVYLQSKGFESDLIFKIINNLEPDE